MVKRCSHGMCDSDNRYPERLEGGVKFVPFPKPRTNFEKCLRWIKLCGRPHEQLNTSRINKNRYICTKHFANGMWPTEEFPDPLPAESYISDLKSRRPYMSKRRKLLSQSSTRDETCEKENKTSSSGITCSATQTENMWVDPVEMMSLVAENKALRAELAKAKFELMNRVGQPSKTDREITYNGTPLVTLERIGPFTWTSALQS